MYCKFFLCFLHHTHVAKILRPLNSKAPKSCSPYGGLFSSNVSKLLTLVIIFLMSSEVLIRIPRVKINVPLDKFFRKSAFWVAISLLFMGCFLQQVQNFFIIKSLISFGYVVICLTIVIFDTTIS